MNRGVGAIILGFAAALLVVAITLSARNGTFANDPFSFVSIAAIATWVVVGVVLVRRVPGNPIGWLFIVAGLGVMIGGTADEYATYTIVTTPGALPLGTFAEWLSYSWGGISVAIPLVILLFPTGHVPSPRWRWVARGLVASAVLLTVGLIFRPALIDVTDDVRLPNPTGIRALHAPLDLMVWIGALGLLALSIAAIAGLVMRFRAAVGEEKQQLRWLTTIGALTGAFLLLTLLTQSMRLRPFSDIFYTLFLLSISVGIPASVAIALLRYRLYDLDLVVRRTVLYATVAVVLMAAFLTVAVVVGGLVGRSQAGAVVAAAAIGLAFWPVLRLSRRFADRIVYGGRATSYEVLTAFGERMSESYSTDDVLPRTAELLATATGARHATVWLRVGRDLRPVAAWPSEDAISEAVHVDGDALPAIPAGWATEVRDRGELLGALAVDMPASDPIDPSRQRVVRDLAAQAGLVLRNVRLIEELRASRQRLVAAQDDERRKLERNIHDGAQQQLVALAVQLKLAERMAGSDPDRERELLAGLGTQVNETLDDLRSLAHGIFPPLLADKGLPAALESQARRAAVPVTLESDGVGRYPQDVEAAVYFCTLEALNNVAKYANAAHVTVTLAQADGHLTFAVTDDGVGFDPVATNHGSGLQGMADRLDAIDGTLEIVSTPGNGTTVHGTVPAEPAA